MSYDSMIEAIAQNEASVDEVWAADADAKLRELATRKKFINIDDVWALVPPPPGNPSKVGAVMTRAGKRGGYIQRTDYRVFSERGNHDNIMVWRSLVFTGGDETFPAEAVLHAKADEAQANAALLFEKAREYHDAKAATGAVFNAQFDALMQTIEDVFGEDTTND